MKIIMVSGWKRSGKDTAAQYLVEKYGFKRVAFADLLKDMVSKEYEVPRSHMDDPLFKEEPILSLPADPQDDFSRKICEMMIGELRDTHGKRPHGFCYQEGKFYGLVNWDDKSSVSEKKEIKTRVYWCARALCILKGSGNRAVLPSYWVKNAVKRMLEDKDSSYVISDVRYKSEIEQIIQFAGRENVVSIRVERFDTCESTDPSERDLDDYSFDIKINNKDTLESFFFSIKQSLKL